MNAQWRIELFGGLRVVCGDRVITHFTTQKVGALLAALAYHCGQFLSRESLIDLFWSEAEKEDGRSSLRNALSALRKLGLPIESGRAFVRLSPAVATDVAEFVKLLVSAEQATRDDEQMNLLAQAVELYRGELLVGYYEEWILPQQRWMEEIFFRAARQLIEQYESVGDFSRALDTAHLAVSIDPLREEVHCDLMRLYAAIGQPVLALRQHRELERVFAEAGISPSDAARQLAQQISKQLVVNRHQSVEGGKQKAEGREQPRTQNPEPSRLPLSLTRFFGRKTEIADIRKMLLAPDMRLVTLTGPGGIGKTRLAIEATRQLQDEFRGSVWFVPLADLSAPCYIAEAVRDALRIEPSPNVEAFEEVVMVLSQQSSLLLLDNFEHLSTGGAHFVLSLLQRVPSLKCLVTSRRCLSLDGEHGVIVKPLPTPEGWKNVQQLSRWTSVQLFVDRAKSARPDFRLTAENASAVAALCERLEGIPLAIELAAARAAVLSPSDILERLSQRFEVLKNDRADDASRHWSLWVTMDWSYRLLPPLLQKFFARLSIFRGSWTLEAAEQVCALSADFSSGLSRFSEEAAESNPFNLLPQSVDSALDRLTQLRTHSLIQPEESASQMRFRLLETLREFAAEQLTAEERDLLSHRHAEYFLRVAQEMIERQDLSAADLRQLTMAQADLLAAFDHCLERNAVSEAKQIAHPLIRLWDTRAPQRQRLHLLHRLLERADSLSLEEHLRLLTTIAYQSEGASTWGTAESFYKDALEVAHQLGDQGTRAVILNSLARIACRKGDLKAADQYREELLRASEGVESPFLPIAFLRLKGETLQVQGDLRGAMGCFEETLNHFRQVGKQENVAHELNRLGSLHLALGDLRAARALQEESLMIRREYDDLTGVAECLRDLGLVALHEGDAAAARALLEESLTIVQPMEKEEFIACLRFLQGLVACYEGALAEAQRLVEESLTFWRGTKQPRWNGVTLRQLSLIAFHEGKLAEAQALCEESLALYQQVGDQINIADNQSLLGHILTRRGDTAQAALLLHNALEVQRQIGAQLSIVRSLERLAHLSVAQNNAGQAARLIGAAEAMRETLGAPLPSVERSAYNRLLTQTRKSLGDKTFQAARAEGKRMTMEEAVAFALNETA